MVAKKVERGEILPIADYETIRERFRARVIAEKKARRIALGEHMSAVFENHDTVLLQIQEMLRTERITRESSVQHEIDTYNELVPGPDELSATLFVEIPDAELREKMLVEMAGLESTFFLEVDGVKYPARSETRGVLPDRTTAVHYVKFPLGPVGAAAFKRGAKALLGADHPKYRATTELAPESKSSLAEDL
jgi:hypothetical protein